MSNNSVSRNNPVRNNVGRPPVNRNYERRTTLDRAPANRSTASRNVASRGNANRSNVNRSPAGAGTRNKKKTGRKKKTTAAGVFLNILLVVCLGAIVFSVYNVSTILWAYRVAEKEYDDLREFVNSADQSNLMEEIPLPQEGQSAISAPDEQERVPYTSPVDFAGLQAINPDVVAWIVIPNTSINYPVVRGSNNERYLNHTVKGEYNKSGSIFMDYLNAPDFSDNHTIIYGHHMNDGSMFTPLDNYESEAFFRENPVFYIYQQDKWYVCEVVASYTIPGENQIYNLNYAHQDNWTTFVNYILGKSLYDAGVEIGEADRIVTLSTCNYDYDDARLVVQAKITEFN